MDSRWFRVAMISMIGIFVCIIVLILPIYFGRSEAMYSSNMMGTMTYGMKMAAQENQISLADLHKQLIDIKSLMSIGLPTAIALGLINLWRSYRKD